MDVGVAYIIDISLCEKSGFQKNGNLLETTRNRDISSFPVVSISFQSEIPFFTQCIVDRFNVIFLISTAAELNVFGGITR